jgi:hypothetical protein
MRQGMASVWDALDWRGSLRMARGVGGESGAGLEVQSRTCPIPRDHPGVESGLPRRKRHVVGIALRNATAYRVRSGRMVGDLDVGGRGPQLPYRRQHTRSALDAPSITAWAVGDRSTLLVLRKPSRDRAANWSIYNGSNSAVGARPIGTLSAGRRRQANRKPERKPTT